jgi:hypothetical protein
VAGKVETLSTRVAENHFRNHSYLAFIIASKCVLDAFI